MILTGADFRVRQLSVRELRRHLEHGHFAVPKLQREFVWNGTKAAKLLDSIYRGFPIGGLMIWQAPRTARFALRDTLHVLPAYQDGHPHIWFLIDGQQRLSVIHRAFPSDGTPAKPGRVDFSGLFQDSWIERQCHAARASRA